MEPGSEHPSQAPPCSCSPLSRSRPRQPLVQPLAAQVGDEPTLVHDVRHTDTIPAMTRTYDVAAGADVLVEVGGYRGSEDGQATQPTFAIARDRATGSERWRRADPSYEYAEAVALSPDSTVAYLTVRTTNTAQSVYDDGVIALDTATGDELWRSIGAPAPALALDVWVTSFAVSTDGATLYQFRVRDLLAGFPATGIPCWIVALDAATARPGGRSRSTARASRRAGLLPHGVHGP
ncbi:MAG: hypothetical protein R3F34_01400 [Planctomycetota bacterium]